MPLRSVRIAFAVPPLLAVFLGFLGLTQVDENGVLDVSAVVTAASESGSASNHRVAAALERVALEQDATVVRVVADRSSPVSRRIALVTTAPSTRGAAWLEGGYRGLAPGVTTRVRPVADLDRYDSAGPYQVIGDRSASTAVASALAELGFAVTTEPISLPARLGITSSASETRGLIAAVVLGCATLGIVGTVGAPRRIAVSRLSGRSTVAILLAELSEVRVSVAVVAAAAPVMASILWFVDGFASWGLLAAAVGVFCALLLLPIALAVGAGALLACRAPIAVSVRGARPPGGLVLAGQLARIPAAVLLVAVAFDLVGSIAVARSGGAERDLRAAGDAVQLWVTPDHAPDAESQPYWDRIGAFAARSLESGAAFLAATTEIGSGTGSGTIPALVVDREYLRRQPLRAADGSRIGAAADEISVWIPESVTGDRAALVDGLARWELRDAPGEQRRAIGGGTLAASAPYTYPGDSGVVAPVVVVVPDPSAVFSADQLGSWLSTGDVVFRSARAADRAIADSDVAGEFSAVVAVGQEAAEQARHAATGIRIQAAALVGTAVVAGVLSVLATSAHRRRHGVAFFARVASGASFTRADAGLLATEAVLLIIALGSVLNAWWTRRPDSGGSVSALDPVARSAGDGAVVAGVCVLILTAVSAAVVCRSGARTARTRGKVS